MLLNCLTLVQVLPADLGCGKAGEFDLAWSMESGEHMPDKQKFVNELVRVTAPGGRIIIVTWCALSFAHCIVLRMYKQCNRICSDVCCSSQPQHSCCIAFVSGLDLSAV